MECSFQIFWDWEYSEILSSEFRDIASRGRDINIATLVDGNTMLLFSICRKKTAKSHKNLAKHVLFKIVSYRHNFTHLVVRRLYYNIYTFIYNFSIHAFFFICTSNFFRASLVLNFEPIFYKFLSRPTLYPSNICLKWYLGLVSSLSTIHSFVARII